MKPSHSPLDNRRRSSRRKGKSLDNEGIDAMRKENILNSHSSEGQKPPPPPPSEAFDVAHAGSNSHFRHIDGDESSSDDKKRSSTATTTKTTTTKKDNGILSLFGGTLLGSEPLFTDDERQQPTPKEVHDAKFPNHETVKKAKARAEKERPVLMERVGSPHLDEPIQCAVYETVADSHNGCNWLLDAFTCLCGNMEKNNGKPVESSLYYALKIKGKEGFDCAQKTLAKHNLVLEKLDSYDDYIKMKNKTTPESRRRLKEIGTEWATKKGDWHKKGESTSYQSAAAIRPTSNREAYQVLVVREWHDEEMRKGDRILAKYEKVNGAFKSDVGNSWAIAGFSPSNKTAKYKGGFPTLWAAAGGVIWRSVFFIEIQQLDEENFDEEYAAIEVDSDRFQELRKLFHPMLCKKGCTCPVESMYKPYMHRDNHQDLMELLSEGE